MAPNKLSSARSIFEQNIQKNKQAGCDQNILGQKNDNKASSTTRKVSRRLFASKTISLSDSSNVTNTSSSSLGLGDSSSNNTKNNNHLDDNTSSRSSISSVRRRKQSSVSISSSSSQQPKGEATAEQTTSNPSTNLPPVTNTNNNESLLIISSRSRRKEDRQHRSVSSLADHLEKLEVPISSLHSSSQNGIISRHGLGRRGSRVNKHQQLNDAASVHSQQASVSSTIASHRNRIKLPVFRQSAYDRTGASRKISAGGGDKSSNNTGASEHTRNTKNNNHHESSMMASSSSMDDSNQSYGVEQLCESRPSTTSNQASSNSISSSSLSLSSSRRGVGHGSFNRSQPKRTSSTTRRKATTTNNHHDSSDPPPQGLDSSSRNHRKSTSGSSSSNNIHFDTNENEHLTSRQKGPQPISWIRPSAIITDDDESCSQSHHSMPFKSVPFTKSSIKRHSIVSSINNRQQRNNDSSIGSIDSSSSETLGSSSIGGSCDSFSPNKASPAARRQSSSIQRRRQRVSVTSTKKKVPTLKVSSSMQISSKPDREEVALQEQIIAIRKQMEDAKAKLMLIEEGGVHDLKRVQETKERKLKRVDATKAKEKAANNKQSATIVALSKEQEKAKAKESYKQFKIATRQLKQENARIDDQNRKLKLEVLTIASSNGLLEETIAEVLESIREEELSQKQAWQEQDQLAHLAATYQRSILDAEEAIDKKQTPTKRVKATRLIYEDKIDLVVNLMQKKCKDCELVEELTALAAFEDETGWEDGESETEYASEEEEHYVVSRAPYRKIETAVKDRGIRVVDDMLVPTSSHSFHIFS